MKGILARGLSLAAAPTFALMAAVSAAADGGAQSMTCSMHNSALSGMVSMYALMSAFHFQPWLKVLGRRRSEARAA